MQTSVKEKNSPSKLTPLSSPAQSSRRTSIASSAACGVVDAEGGGLAG